MALYTGDYGDFSLCLFVPWYYSENTRLEVPEIKKKTRNGRQLSFITFPFESWGEYSDLLLGGLSGVLWAEIFSYNVIISGPYSWLLMSDSSFSDPSLQAWLNTFLNFDKVFFPLWNGKKSSLSWGSWDFHQLTLFLLPWCLFSNQSYCCNQGFFIQARLGSIVSALSQTVSLYFLTLLLLSF